MQLHKITHLEGRDRTGPTVHKGLQGAKTQGAWSYDLWEPTREHFCLPSFSQSIE